MASKFGYNDKEFEESLDLNTYDLGARQMDPALGRFMVIDPMADFVNYQSPYALADNNPIGNIDAYGLGSEPPGFLRWLLGGSGRNCSCKQREGVVGFVGRLFAPKPNKKRKRKNKKNSSSSSSGTRTTSTTPQDGPRESVTGVGFDPSGLVDIGNLGIDTPNIDLPQVRVPQSPPIPEFNGTPITRPIGFDKNVEFNEARNTFKNVDYTEKILNDLIKTLKEYPQLKVLILGNTSSKPKDEATVNKNPNKYIPRLQDLQLQRARAVEQFLIGKGISWRRISVGNGEIRFQGQKGRTTTFILKN